jgi:hypothetical protein
MASTAAGASSTNATATLSEATLQPLVDEALHRWSLSQDVAMVEALHDIQIHIADLPGLELGRVQDGEIILDLDAAGRGWFVDVTPEDNAEFRPPNADGDLISVPSSEAFGHMDLLTVVMHEIGHVLGLQDEDTVTHAHDLMAATLAAGVRRLPETPLALPEALPSRTSPASGKPEVETLLAQPDAVVPHAALTPGEPEVRYIKWDAEAPPPAALVFDAGTGTLSTPSAALFPPARPQAGPAVQRHTARIAWESAGAETHLMEQETLTQSSWWRRLQRLLRHGPRAADVALTTGRG